LWQPKDAGLLAYFIEKLVDPDEKERAWQRYHAIRAFVESGRCRHYQVCHHFGQSPKWERCEMCDVCGNTPEWLTAKPEEKLAVARKKTPARAQPAGAGAGPGGGDMDLIEFFKEWRRRTAQQAGVPAYVVLNDASLEDLCRKRPSNLRELLGVFGIGERKAELYGSEIFGAFEAFEKGSRAAARETKQVSPAEETLRLLAEGKSFEEIGQIRGRQATTVVNMVADLIEKGRLEYREAWVGAEAQRRIQEAIDQHGSQWLKPLREALPPEITYDQIRLVVASARRATAK
jgi:ATP-dependent DNA helicase RecQ